MHGDFRTQRKNYFATCDTLVASRGLTQKTRFFAPKRKILRMKILGICIAFSKNSVYNEGNNRREKE